MLAKRVSELEVYKVAFELQQEIFKLTKSFPKEETYSLTDQIRRSSRSIGANICEAWAKRRYESHFISKLSDSEGEQIETCHWLQTAHDCGYLSIEKLQKLQKMALHVGGILNKMMQNASSWC